MRHFAHTPAVTGRPQAGQITVDLKAIADNVGILRKHSQGAGFMAVVKGNAYGHGLLEVSRTALDAGADWLGTAQLAEAVALRQAGVTAPILAWLYLASSDSGAIRSALETDIDVSVGSLEPLEAVAAIAKERGTRAQIHLELDSGLSRGGARADEWAKLVAAAAAAEQTAGPGGVGVRGLCDAPGLGRRARHPGNAAAVAGYEAAVGQARAAGLDPQLRHVASSANVLARPEYHFDMVRAGLAMYGLSPADHLDPADFGLRPALRCHGAAGDGQEGPGRHRRQLRAQGHHARNALSWADPPGLCRRHPQGHQRPRHRDGGRSASARDRKGVHGPVHG